jgi:hypothetical protein
VPAYSEKARQSSPEGLPRDALFDQALLKAHLGCHLKRSEAPVPAKLPRRAVGHLPQSLFLLSTLEGPMNSARMLGAWLKGLRESLLVESAYGVAWGLWIAAQLVSDLVGVHAPGACEQYLATA